MCGHCMPRPCESGQQETLFAVIFTHTSFLCIRPLSGSFILLISCVQHRIEHVSCYYSVHQNLLRVYDSDRYWIDIRLHDIS